MELLEVTNTIKALITAKKGGMPIEDLEKDFFELEGRPIPYLKLGYKSLFHYLREVKAIKTTKNECGNPVLVVEDQRLDHLKHLIENQKPAKFSRIQKLPKNKKYFRSHQTNYRKRNNNTSYYNYYNGSCGPSGFLSSSLEEVQQPPMVFMDTRRNIEDVHEPIFNGKQLLGDDFFLQLAIRNLGIPVWRKAEKTALYSGLCVSGQTILDCTKRLRKIQSISERVTIMLGAVDIYHGRSIYQMKEDYIELLDLLEVKFNISRSKITLCTLPPLANLSFMTDFEKTSTLRLFNNWIRKKVREEYDFIHGTYSAYHLVDFYQHYTNDVDQIQYEYFQNDARNVSGTRHPWVLWNKKGRRIAMELLYY